MPSARTRVSSARHCVSDALLTLPAKFLAAAVAKYCSNVK